MEITRKEALLKGETQYFSGNACVQGHTSPRRAKTGECLDCRKIALKTWRSKNKHAVQQHNATQYLKYELNKVQWQERNKKYAKNNKAKVNAKTVAYQLAKEHRIPGWVDSEELWLIKEAYDLAVKRSKLTGFAWHVDHVVPLRGIDVSGLHAINNLQVIPAIQNIKKSNRYKVI